MHAIGTISRYRARNVANSSLSANLKMPASGETAPTLMFVAVRASAPVCGKPFNSGINICTQPWPHSSLFGIERNAAVVGEPIGHPRTEQALHARHEHDRDR